LRVEDRVSVAKAILAQMHHIIPGRPATELLADAYGPACLPILTRRQADAHLAAKLR